jgi:hypothetical protein
MILFNLALDIPFHATTNNSAKQLAIIISAMKTKLTATRAGRVISATARITAVKTLGFDLPTKVVFGPHF